MSRWLPGLELLRTYRAQDLAADLLAGVVLTAFLVPVGVGYAQASGLPPITGLYATMAPLVAYALFGPSRIMVLGPDSSLTALIVAVIAPLSAGDEVRAAGLAGLLGVLTGIGIAGAGLLRLGFVSELLSRPVQLGYLAAVALLVLVGQLPKALGVRVQADGVFAVLAELTRAVAAGKVVLPSLALSAGAVGVSVVLRRYAPKVPAALVAVVLGVGSVRLLHLDELGVRVLGALPAGLPPFGFPAELWRAAPDLLGGALGIALVTIADTTVLSQSLAGARDEDPQPDQELLAMGLANVAAGLFGGFPVSASASRTPVAAAAGARTQVTGVVGALTVLALLLVAPRLLSQLPIPVLAGVVMVAATGLVETRAIRFLWRASRTEVGLFAVAFVAVATIGVLQGIFLAVVLSLGDFVRRAWRPHDAVLGRVDELKGYHDVSRYEGRARRIPGLLLYRFDAPLFFANAPHFRDRLRALTTKEAALRWVVIAAEPITDVDTTAAEVLEDVQDELHKKGIALVFAELKDPTKDRLRRYGIFDRLGAERFFPTVGTAVDAYLAAHPVEWVDWEDRSSSP